MNTEHFDTRTAIFEAAWSACKKYIPGDPGNLNGPTLTPQQVAKTLKFAECMRAHGVTDYPDPPAAGQAPKPPLGGFWTGVNSSTFDRAAHACGRVAGISITVGPTSGHPCTSAFSEGKGQQALVLTSDLRGFHSC